MIAKHKILLQLVLYGIRCFNNRNMFKYILKVLTVPATTRLYSTTNNHSDKFNLKAVKSVIPTHVDVDGSILSPILSSPWLNFELR